MIDSTMCRTKVMNRSNMNGQIWIPWKWFVTQCGCKGLQLWVEHIDVRSGLSERSVTRGAWERLCFLWTILTYCLLSCLSANDLSHNAQENSLKHLWSASTCLPRVAPCLNDLSHNLQMKGFSFNVQSQHDFSKLLSHEMICHTIGK